MGVRLADGGSKQDRQMFSLPSQSIIVILVVYRHRNIYITNLGNQTTL